MKRQTKLTRIQFDVAASMADLLDKLVKKSGATTRAEVLRQAIRLYDYVVEKQDNSVTISFKNGLLLIQESAPRT
jgi:metal-responsive CopG/Arc/MetJ family transcriptional regulator